MAWRSLLLMAVCLHHWAIVQADYPPSYKQAQEEAQALKQLPYEPQKTSQPTFYEPVIKKQPLKPHREPNTVIEAPFYDPSEKKQTPQPSDYEQAPKIISPPPWPSERKEILPPSYQPPHHSGEEEYVSDYDQQKQQWVLQHPNDQKGHYPTPYALPTTKDNKPGTSGLTSLHEQRPVKKEETSGFTSWHKQERERKTRDKPNGLFTGMAEALQRYADYPRKYAQLRYMVHPQFIKSYLAKMRGEKGVDPIPGLVKYLVTAVGDYYAYEHLTKGLERPELVHLMSNFSRTTKGKEGLTAGEIEKLVTYFPSTMTSMDLYGIHDNKSKKDKKKPSKTKDTASKVPVGLMNALTHALSEVTKNASKPEHIPQIPYSVPVPQQRSAGGASFGEGSDQQEHQKPGYPHHDDKHEDKKPMAIEEIIDKAVDLLKLVTSKFDVAIKENQWLPHKRIKEKSSGTLKDLITKLLEQLKVEIRPVSWLHQHPADGLHQQPPDGQHQHTDGGPHDYQPQYPSYPDDHQHPEHKTPGSWQPQVGLLSGAADTLPALLGSQKSPTTPQRHPWDDDIQRPTETATGNWGQQAQTQHHHQPDPSGLTSKHKPQEPAGKWNKKGSGGPNQLPGELY